MIRAFLIAAVTADGFIARAADQISTAWTSAADRKFFSEMTKRAGVIVMGKRTYETIGKPLPGRRTIVYAEPGTSYEGVEVTQKTPAELLAQLEAEGCAEVAICGGASIYTMFMEAGAIDTLYLTVHPVAFGTGIRLFARPLNTPLILVSHTQLAPDVIVLEYQIHNSLPAYGRTHEKTDS